MTRQFSTQSERRIARSVIWTERQSRTVPPPRGQKFSVPTGPAVAIAAADIEHDAFGNCDIATGTDFDSSLSADSTRRYSVYNPFLKIWSGSRLLMLQTRLAGGRNQYNIIQHWSATSIIATAPAGGLGAGGSATCTSVSGRNGHYSPTSTTVYSWTTNVDVGASEKLLAELVWTGTVSRWEVYSADCV